MKLFYCMVIAASLAQPAFAASDRLFEGVYTWGHEVETFSPCGSKGKRWWVVASEPLLEKLRDATLRLTTSAYEGIYVRVTGDYAGPATEETGGAFSMQYEGLFEVTTVWFTRKLSASDCNNFTNSSD